MATDGRMDVKIISGSLEIVTFESKELHNSVCCLKSISYRVVELCQYTIPAHPCKLHSHPLAFIHWCGYCKQTRSKIDMVMNEYYSPHSEILSAFTLPILLIRVITFRLMLRDARRLYNYSSDMWDNDRDIVLTNKKQTEDLNLRSTTKSLRNQFQRWDICKEKQPAYISHVSDTCNFYLFFRDFAFHLLFAVLYLIGPINHRNSWRQNDGVIQEHELLN